MLGSAEVGGCRESLLSAMGLMEQLGSGGHDLSSLVVRAAREPYHVGKWKT